mmetsp:Transcript_31578/g.58193  ORF Transcript_31578/g.58193 Transcript_31578/m.58193 type:complete len:108 (+) Transcript_31578:69-392(+)
MRAKGYDLKSDPLIEKTYRRKVRKNPPFYLDLSRWKHVSARTQNMTEWFQRTPMNDDSFLRLFTAYYSSQSASPLMESRQQQQPTIFPLRGAPSAVRTSSTSVDSPY